ncbi:putative oxidoreductase YdbC [compost metagenome]
MSVEQLEEASQYAKIVSVQNLYNLSQRTAEPVLEYAESHNLAFIPWFPLATGALAKEGGKLDTLSKRLGAKPSQLALAWLLKRSKVTLPIPGTSSVAHLEENIDAAGITLSDADFAELSNLI